MFFRFILAGILTTTFALAQGGNPRGGMGEGGMGEGGMGRGSEGNMPSAPRVSNRIDVIGDSLKLDKDQKKNVKNILDAAQKEANPVHDQLAKSRLAVGEAIQDGKNQEEVSKLLNSQAALESQMAGIELNAFAKIYKALEQEQRNKTQTLFQMMKGIFDNKNWNAMP